ncbi:MAG: malto-oligosyltrehalose synthase [bacterium]|jgi:(1->4)-alpha-D-glucan 1-alpha-D-glucosylmutase|nr:malto-oligosyltrehalose synthase [bacterium]
MAPVTSTYRLQLGPDLDLDAAAGLLPYLRRLGVSHAYLSPVLQAAPGSTHGYDVVDHSRVSAELGGEAAWERLVAAAREWGVGLVLDVVPNHMAIAGRHNRWWWDVLENGASSRYASHFDIAWNPPERRLRGRILMPVLCDHYGRVLERRELCLHREHGALILTYFDHELPIGVDTAAPLLEAAAARSGSKRLGALAPRCGALPTLTAQDRDEAIARDLEKDALKAELGIVCTAEPGAADALNAEITAVNADLDRLDALLSTQHYRLARWKTAATELDYRRFFDIPSLVGLRVEDEHVFQASHRLVLEWLREGRIDGLRIDHVDGLRDPEDYLHRLRDAAPNAPVWVEKILEHGEQLPSGWPVAGTTGYDAGALLTRLFVDPAGEAPLTRLWQGFTGETDSWEVVSRIARLDVLRQLLGSDLNRLAGAFVAVLEGTRRLRDFTRQEATDALREVLACLGRYRTYVRPEHGQVSEQDRRVVRAAVDTARAGRPDLDAELFDFVAAVLLLEARERATPGRAAQDEFVARFQQTSDPVRAKGVEDTAYYRHLRLTCLNEVGGDPDRFGATLDELHTELAARATAGSSAMTTTSTHDSKRGEDVRARLALLSEIPDRWRAAVEEWSRLARRHRRGKWPDPALEYLLYQTLVGAWPLSGERAAAHVLKAAREAKRQTSWIAPDPDYEDTLLGFVRGCLDDRAFVEALERFLEPLLPAAWITSLSMKLLALTVPGVPDLYQGSELWHLRLVDPDNRGAVDFAGRAALLDEVDRLPPEECWKRAAEGLPKLLVVSRALRLRRRRPDVFCEPHRPLRVAGPGDGHLVAFARGDGLAVLAPRLVLGLGEPEPHWRDTTVGLPEGSWHDELRGEPVAGGSRQVGELLGPFPVGLLSR